MFNNKIVNIVFSILVAIGLWVYVVGEINPETTGKFQDVPIRFVNAAVLAEDDLALADPGNPTVTVTISGTRADMKELTASEIDVTADLSGLAKGENRVDLAVSLPNDMKLLSISDDKVRVVVEALVTAEKPVQIRYEGEIPEGKEPGAITLSTDTVAVSGAASSIQKVQAVAAVVSASQINADPVELEAGLSAVDKEGNRIPYLFLSQNQATVRVTMLDLLTVPLELSVKGTVPNGYILKSSQKPETITIKGTAEALSGIESIKGGSIDISGEKESVDIPIQLTLPEGVELAASSPEPTLQLIIEPKTAKSFTYDSGDLTPRGLAAGLAVDIPTQSILLSVQSSADVAAGLRAGDFTLALDLEGFKAGTYKVAIAVETQKTGIDYSVAPKEIQIIIREE